MFCSMTVSVLYDWQRESLEVCLMDVTKWIEKNKKAFSAHSEIIDVAETAVCELQIRTRFMKKLLRLKGRCSFKVPNKVVSPRAVGDRERDLTWSSF